MNLEFLRHLPVKRKLVAMTLAACGVILLLACAGLFAFQVFIFKRTLARDLVVLAAVVSANARGPISFQDHMAAEGILEAVRAQGQVVAARIELPDDSEFARIGVVPARGPKTGTAEGAVAGASYYGSDLYIVQRIVRDGEFLGTLYLRADLRRVYLDLVWLYAGILALVFGSAFVVALLVSARLQRFITDPVFDLAQTARSVAEHRDYSVRARKYSRDEFGLLTDAFNQMLGEIQTQDAALRDSESRYRVLFESSPVPKYVFDLKSLRFMAVNDASIEHYGYSREEFLAMTIRDIRPESGEIPDGPSPEEETGIGRTARPWRHRKKNGTLIHVEISSHEIELEGMPCRLVLALDITERKNAETELARVNKQLIDASRQAGMAEVANSVLHNVGNVLNSVNVSATVVADRLRQSALADFPPAVQLMRERSADLAVFLTSDSRGQQLPGFLSLLAEHWVKEQADLLKETETLAGHVRHIKEVVKRQQALSGLSGMVEVASVSQIVLDAIAINAASLEKAAVAIISDLAEIPPLLLDTVKLEQILVNLIRNAQEAMAEGGVLDKRICVRSCLGGDGQLHLVVEDNGVGIPPEVMARLFTHGFTTKKTGHGFGLHASFIATREMGGTLRADSEGQGRGARFTILLPARRPETPTQKEAA